MTHKKETYKIVRFFRDERREPTTIKRGLTLEEAQAHCQREDTEGEDWFDGYIYERGS